MNTTFKINDTEFTLNLPDIENQSVSDTLKLWCEMSNTITAEKDEWVTLPYIPEYKFKNLKLVPELDDLSNSAVLNITFTFDEWKKI